MMALSWAKYCWPNEDWTHDSLLALHTTNKVLCGRHFASSQFYDDKRQKLSKFAVPDSTELDEVLAEKENILKQNIEQSASQLIPKIPF
ncbi:hypothetical protein HF086_011409 [Spodoptera exigua]|uniref:THAP-type domain-containing protein n=1 Tax=Spodoptera exigua TaxID=7107 RepID=A0A922SPF9_SPOEX|nr:hypothetical protein HF086_011409 [Spodoptera exigua]